MATTIHGAIETLYAGLTSLSDRDLEGAIEELATLVGMGSAELDRRGVAPR